MKLGKRSLLIFVICISFILSSCNGVSRFLDNIGGNSNYKNSSNSQILEKENLVLLLISCITNLSEIRKVYAEIPQSQLDSMSFAAFDEYIHALNDMIKNPVESYRFLYGEDRDKMLLPILMGAEDQKELIQRTIPV